jgi:hypothetical protein
LFASGFGGERGQRKAAEEQMPAREVHGCKLQLW